jgi:branched-chain amino acid transport system permease protein
MSAAEIGQQIINALSLGSMYALLALGLALVFGVMGLVNFAYGELVTITGYTMYLLTLNGVPWWIAVCAGLVFATIASLLMERFAFRPLRNASFLTLLFSSFALSVIIQNVFRAAVSPRTKGIEGPALFIRAVHLGPLSVSWLSIITIAVGVACLLGLTVFMRTSLAGIGMRAAAENFSVARLMGVKANRVIALAFVISGLLAGIAGVLWVSRSGSVDPGMGFTPILKAFIATVIGGLGSLPGAVLGGFILAAAEVFFIAVLPTSVAPFSDPFALLLVIVILYFKPNGLLAPVAERA